MPHLERLVSGHYDRGDLAERFLSALETARGGSLEGLTVDELAAADQFHIRGRAATEELAGIASLEPGRRVLDIGSGPGGTARYLASQFGCHVTGLDLTPGFVRLATRLSELVGMSEATLFQTGSATAMPFDSGAFDVVWMEHVQMNIADKARLVDEVYRVLRPGGRLALYEIFAGAAGEPHYPVPWAADASHSFLIAPERMRELLETRGFDVKIWEDVTAACAVWFRQALEPIARSGPPAIGLHLLIGSEATVRLGNISRSLDEGRARVIEAIADKRG